MYTATVGVLALLLSQSPATAGTNGHLLALLKQRIVQQEIELDPKILPQLAELERVIAQGRKELGSTLGLTPNEEVAWLDRMAELKSAADLEGCKLLNEKQQRRLAQIYAQQVGRREHRFNACLLSEIALVELELNDSQRSAIAARSKRFQEELFRALDDFDAEFQRIGATHRQRCLGLLSDRQRSEYLELVGAPFSFSDSDVDILYEVLKRPLENKESAKEQTK